LPRRTSWRSMVSRGDPASGSICGVEEHGPLGAKPVRTLAAGLAESLKAIHAADVVHRDLRPSNVLLAQDGEPQRSHLILPVASSTPHATADPDADLNQQPELDTPML